MSHMFQGTCWAAWPCSSSTETTKDTSFVSAHRPLNSLQVGDIFVFCSVCPKWADLLIFFSMSLCRCFPTVLHWNKNWHFLAIIFQRSTVACELRLCRDEPAHLHSSSLTPWPLGVAGTFRVSAKSLWCYFVFSHEYDLTAPDLWRIIRVECYCCYLL